MIEMAEDHPRMALIDRTANCCAACIGSADRLGNSAHSGQLNMTMRLKAFRSHATASSNGIGFTDGCLSTNPLARLRPRCGKRDRLTQRPKSCTRHCGGRRSWLAARPVASILGTPRCRRSCRIVGGRQGYWSIFSCSSQGSGECAYSHRRCSRSRTGG